MQAAYSQLRKKDYKPALRTLTTLAARTSSKTAAQAQSMLDYAMEIVRHDFEKSEVAYNSGDFVLAKTLLAESVKRYGSLKIYKPLDANLKAASSNPENQNRLKRGREFYRVIKLLEVRPKSFHKQMKRFIEADVDGFYSRLTQVKRVRDEVLNTR